MIIMDRMPADRVQWRGWELGVVAGAYLLRILYAAKVELLPEEAYYWNYSRHLDIGYLDHPPMVAWLIRLGTSLFGSCEFGVRVGALGCGAIAAVFIFRLTRHLFGSRSALLALVMVQVLPFFFLSGLLMTPDAPLTAAWAAALYFLARALTGGEGRAWLWAGLSIGIGLVSKYSIALLGMGACVFMLLDPGSRRWFGRWQPYVALLLAAAIFSPVVLWNAQHDWASFAFQTTRRLAEPARFSVHKLIGSAMVLLTPVGLAAAVAAVARTEAPARGWLLLRCAVLAPLSVFALFSIRHEVKLDWTGAPWTAAVPLMAAGLARANARAAGASRWLRFAWPPTVTAMLVLYGVGWVYLVPGLPAVGYTQHMELVPVGWRSFARQIDGISDAWRATHADRLLVVGMDRYATASELAFYSADQDRAVDATSSAHLFGERGLMYERWFPVAQQSGRSVLMVAWDREALSAAHLDGRLVRLGDIQEGIVRRAGRGARAYYYRFGTGYTSP